LTLSGKSERGRFNKGAVMHQQAITREQLIDIHAKMEVFGRVEKGAVLTTVGKHPTLGSCIVRQDPTRDLVVLSEFPFKEPIRVREASER
jgi:hypothetical protein